MFVIDPRDFDIRQVNAHFRNEAVRIELAPSLDGPPKVEVTRGRRAITAGVTSALKHIAGGYRFEIAAPIDAVLGAADWKSFQLIAALRDVDQPEDQDCLLLWRNTPDPLRRSTLFASFFQE